VPIWHQLPDFAKQNKWRALVRGSPPGASYLRKIDDLLREGYIVGRKYAETLAKNQVDGFKALVQKYGSFPFPPYDKLEEFYCDLYKKQFEGLDDIAEAWRIENFLNNAMFFFFVAIALFLFTGIFPYISISDYSLSGFSVPSMISGVIAVIIACLRIYQIGKKV